MTDPLDYLRANPAASRREVMKACNCSARRVRQAEAELHLQQGKAPRAVLPVGLATAAVVLGLVGVASWLESTPAQAPMQGASRPAARAQEAAIYSALDLADPEQAEQIVAQLSNPDEAVRLAALRYVAKVRPEGHAEALMPLLGDESNRVRAAAIQLLGKVRPQESKLAARVSERLLETLLDEKRELGERVLAVASLRSHRPSDLRRLTQVLDHPQLSQQVSSLLSKWTGRPIERRDGESLRAAWDRQLGSGA